MQVQHTSPAHSMHILWEAGGCLHGDGSSVVRALAAQASCPIDSIPDHCTSSFHLPPPPLDAFDFIFQCSKHALFDFYLDSILQLLLW